MYKIMYLNEMLLTTIRIKARKQNKTHTQQKIQATKPIKKE